MVVLERVSDERGDLSSETQHYYFGHKLGICLLVEETRDLYWPVYRLPEEAIGKPPEAINRVTLFGHSDAWQAYTSSR